MPIEQLRVLRVMGERRCFIGCAVVAGYMSGADIDTHTHTHTHTHL